jgi:uncharacterized protein (TIGR03118 family)
MCNSVRPDWCSSKEDIVFGLQSLKKCLMTTAIAVGAILGSTWCAEAGTYAQTDLVSNVSGLATITDPQLVNPWGISHSATSPFWLSNQGTNNSTLYAVTGSTNVTKTIINPPSGFVTIPTTGVGPQGPTGQIDNGNMSSFLVGNGGNDASAHFVFANLNGTISAWDTGPAAFVQQTVAGASFTGLAVNQAQTKLYAANNAGTGGIKVFDSSFAPLNLGASAFATPTTIGARGLVPFNVQDINGSVYVTYAPAGHAAETAATGGMGAVAVFTEGGALLQTVLSNKLASPWGVAVAPATFGRFGGDLLVGNFSYADSEINAFNLSGTFQGTIPIDTGSAGTGGLWALDFGTGGSNGNPNTLYFTDGINGETGGLFGAISAVPEPATWALFLIGFGVVGWTLRNRKSLATPAA